MTRSQDRVSYPTDIRLSLLEHDVDVFEEHHGELMARLDAMQRLLIGVLVSVATAAILVAINVAITGIGGK